MFYLTKVALHGTGISAMSMKKKLFAVYGASGFGREILPVLRRMLDREHNKNCYNLVFVDDGEITTDTLNGQLLLTYDQFLDFPAEQRYACIAIANSSARSRVAKKCERDGILPVSVIAENATFLDENQLGEGAIFCNYSHVTSNARIGKYFHANIYSYVAHDCVIGDFVTLAPAAKINGNVVIEDFAYIGTGAIIKQGRPGQPIIIGAGAVVGMGAVVTRHVPAGVTVVGNPARPLIDKRP